MNNNINQYINFNNMYSFKKNNQDNWKEINNQNYYKKWELKCYMHQKINDNTNLITFFLFKY